MDTLKIFIVEDEPIEAIDLSSILERIGYTVAGSVMSGEECLEQVTAARPDLVIMDIKLQGKLDGIDTAWELRKICDVPVIFATALSDRSSLARAKVAEPYGYIVKPFNERELYTTIETSLYKYRIDRRLKESETKFRSLFEKSRDAIFILNGEGVITGVNSAMIELTGYGSDSLSGMNIGGLFVEKGDGDSVMAEMNGRGFIENRSIGLRKSDGTELDCLLTSSRIVAGDGADFGYQGIIRDVTGQMRLERVRDVLFHEKIKRVKELNCLYRLADISGNIETPVDEICRQIVETVPTAFQTPGHISVSLTLRDREFTSQKFMPAGRQMMSRISVFGADEGSITVYHGGKTVSGDFEVFSKEDSDLLNAIAERLAIIIERKKTFEDLALSREELRMLSSHLQSLREDERTEISREIHDVLGQSLTALKMDLAWIKNRVNDREELVSRAEAMAGLIDSTIDTVRKISAELRPGLLDDLGLRAAVEWHAEEFQRRTGIACRVSGNLEDGNIDGKVAINIYRILQEALTNIIRHANATKVEVDISTGQGGLTLTVRDNGRGISRDELNNPLSLGLIGIRERALTCGGTIAIGAAPEGGTVVTVHVPRGGTS